jgi:hypothetical protein
MMFFLATGPDGRQVGWQCSNREQAELRARQQFGQPVPVVQVTVMDWRRWKQTR